MGVAILWLVFTLGSLIHWLIRGRSAKRSGVWPTFDAWFMTFWDILLGRTILCGGIFALWISGKVAIFSALFSLVGLNWAIPQIPVNGPTALFFGYFSDSILEFVVDWAGDKFPALKREVPQIPGSTASSANVATAGGSK